MFEWERGVKGSGIPYLQGALYVIGTNETDEETGERIMPNFTSENVLRICMQFQDVNQTKSKGLWESYRWVLNYTFPNEFTNFTT